MPKHHPNIKHGKTGVLLVNLGTPDDCNAKAVRAYLAEFLKDKRVGAKKVIAEAVILFLRKDLLVLLIF